ncbi:MAG: GFA family protein [Gammaproteobacteria bacterium]|nr:GFA family protein [Gammaproteobacteria bacterium]
MNNKTSTKGQCLCKAVTITTSSMGHDISACHCRMCQTWGGGPLLVVECNEEITIGGNDSVETYHSSEWAERGFCNQCGTHLFYRLKQQNQYFIPIGLFNSHETVAFTTEVFIEEKPSYYSFSETTEKLTGEELFKLYSS